MRHLHPHYLAPVAAALLLASVAPAHPRHDVRPRPVLARRAAAVPNPPSREDTLRALHLLGRATFGARPEDLAEVLRIGTDAWLDRQLHPARIDDSALEARLARFPAASMSVGRLVADYPPPRPDPAARAQRDSLRQARESAAAMRQMAPDSGMAMREDGAAFPRQRRQAGGARRGPQAILFDLAGAKLQRAVYSDRQLQEVMTDFWFNHFNVFFGKNLDRYLVGAYERETIRPRVFGRFRDLLGATAHHPAMLVYLDNARSAVADSMRGFSPQGGGVRGMGMGARPRPGGAFGRGRVNGRMRGDSMVPARQRPTGLNENYARELMELHTLGVDGGYTQHDVVEVARALTGWTVDRGPGRTDGDADPRFIFRPMLHDFGPKTILGQQFPAGRGQEEGEAVLDLLARSPATARHVARKLAERFVADDPPPALVERLAETFLRTDGDLAAVTRALFTAPEFYEARWRGTKVKTPLEFVASALRATGADVGPSRTLLMALRQLGQVPYLSSAPTGYPAASAEWTNSGAMLNRMNFALSLAAGRVDGVSVDEARFRPALAAPDTRARVAALARTLMPAGGDPRLLATIAGDVERQQGDERAAAARALGLLLGSPDFQRR
ncbi:MAG: DUF1800 domain-containing protein [Longimicrobiaceae bacterium]